VEETKLDQTRKTRPTTARYIFPQEQITHKFCCAMHNKQKNRSRNNPYQTQPHVLHAFTNSVRNKFSITKQTISFATRTL